MPSLPQPGREEPPDLRMVAIGAAAWAGGLLAVLAPSWLLLAGLVSGPLAIACARVRGRPAWLLAGCVLAATAVAASGTVRAELHRTSPVAQLAAEEAVVTITGQVRGDPVERRGRFGSYVLARLRAERVTGRGVIAHSRVPVLVIGEPGWLGARLGETVRVVGRLRPAEDSSTAAVLTTSRPPTILAPASPVHTAAESVRGGIRRSVAGAGRDPRALVPALVVGDDRAMTPRVVADFRTCGLTHLAAVSGTNLTLVVGSLLLLARLVGVRSRALVLVGVLGVAGFVVLARPEPSVVRAAAMGSVALLGMGRGGRRAGARAAGVAVFGLLLLDPWLAVSFGFVLSVLATAGILFLAPMFRDQLMAWLPRWAAEAVAVPLAAQLACTPVVAVLSGQISLVAVVANLLVAPAVAPATVLGLVGGLLMLVAAPVGLAIGWLAGLCGGWIVLVATQLARLPQAALDWSTGPVPVLLLAVACLLVSVNVGRLLRSRSATLAACLVLAALTVRPLPTPGWPPQGWVMVACDVGQGDGLVFNAGEGRALVVDVGPDPARMDRCLDRLGVDEVPLVVLTHFHADHVDGLPGVLDDAPGEVVVTAMAAPVAGAHRVRAWAERAGARTRTASYGETGQLGPLTWQVVGPPAPVPSAGAEGSTANNASVVLLVEVSGLRILAAGDIEPEAQAALARSLPRLRVDVLKVPHHGSRYQDARWLTGLGARLGIISAGADNDYGHPAPATVRLLEAAGMLVWSTSDMGSVAVVADQGELRVRSRG